MRRLVRQLVPSMFQRRLMLLAVVVVAAAIVLGARVAQLTIAQGAQWQDHAEDALQQRHYIPTKRGRILDRKFRVLAEERPGYDLSVRYPVIVGSWAFERARVAARKTKRWRQIGPAERLRLIAHHRRPFDEQVENLWSTLCEIGQIDRSELDDRLHTVTRRVQSMVSAVRMVRLRLWEDDLDEPDVKSQVSQPIGEQQALYSVLGDLDDDARLVAGRLIAAGRASTVPDVWVKVSIEPSGRRHYPRETISLEIDRSTLPSVLQRAAPQRVDVEGVGIHIIGALRRSWLEQEQNPFLVNGREDLKGYLPGDLAGEWGLERSFEGHLRGTRGRTVHHLDTQRRTRTQPKPGADVVSSIDIHLQARVEALMNPDFGLLRAQTWHTVNPSGMLGTPLRGAAVVLDVAQGQVLAAVTVPSFTRREWRHDAKAIRSDAIHHRFWNRAVFMPYQPGSTVKPLLLAAAVTDGVLAYNETIHCGGYLLEDKPNRLRCWIYKLWDSKHNDLTGPEAIKHSCNVFYFTLGRRFGAQRLVRWYGRYGLGRRHACGLAEESRGRLPDLKWADDPRAGFSIDHSTQMGIGQGPMEWTPLQAANAYACLARGGYMLRPTFVIAPSFHGDDTHRKNEDLELDRVGVSMAHRGMSMAANDQHGGTVHHLTTLNDEPIFNVPGIDVYAKSGTATAVKPKWTDLNRNGRRESHERWVDANRNRLRDEGEQVLSGDHAWCMAMARPTGAPVSAQSRSGPHIVVAVVVEYGGSGGLVAGPVANQILHALRAEGYL